MANWEGLVLAQVVTNTSKAQNVDLLAADFQVSHADALVRITVVDSGTVDIRLVPSAGSAIIIVATTTANLVNTVELALDTGRTWNIQSANASGLTTTLCVVQEIPQ